MPFYARRWTRQPGPGARIDWGCSLADGILSVLLPSAGLNDLATQTAFSIAGAEPTKVIGGPGVGVQFDGASCLYRPEEREPDGYTATQVVIFEPARLTNDEAVVGMDDSGLGRNYTFFVATASGDPFYAGVRSDTNAAANAISGASGAALGVPMTIAAQYESSARRSVWINGIRRAQNTTTVASVLTPNFVSYGAGYKSSVAQAGTTGRIYMAAQWSRCLSDNELQSVCNNPWQLFAPRRIWVPQAAITGLPTLSLPTYTPGSLTATGFRPRVTAT